MTATAKLVTVRVMDLEQGAYVRRRAEWIRAERVPVEFGTGEMMDSIIVRLDGRLIRTNDDGVEMCESCYSADSRYDPSGRDLGPA